jgi:rfaE bifunctional protein kinase chain/domain
VVRIDRVPQRRADPGRLWDGLVPRLRRFDGIVLSDYGYGSAEPSAAARIAASARSLRIPVVADSRFRMGEFSRITAVTPNITELEAVTGVTVGGDERLLHRVGRAALSRQKLACLLVTQGRFGMTLFEPHRSPIHIPVFGTDEVADVTGAGDTVISVFTLALSCGALPEEAARLSNYAGGIVVMKRGTATVTADELRAAVESDRDGLQR